jgi:hypothetical protein
LKGNSALPDWQQEPWHPRVYVAPVYFRLN